jgi:outer membrane murein-binding lipoprotein Lpp
MIISKKISGKFYLLLTAVIMVFVFSGCGGSSGSGNDIRALEETVNSLKSNVSTLQNDLNEMQTKNKALESDLQALKGEVNSLKITTH